MLLEKEWGGEEELAFHNESTKFRGFICPSRMRESSAMDTHVHNISTKLENIYEASRKMNEKSVAKALWVLCALFIWNASNVPPERRCFVTFLMIYLAFGESYRLVWNDPFRFRRFFLRFCTRIKKNPIFPISFDSIISSSFRKNNKSLLWSKIFQNF